MRTIKSLLWMMLLLGLPAASFFAEAQMSMSPAPGVRLLDEGTAQGQVQILDCVGAGIACTKSGSTGTFTISGGAPTDATYLTQTAHADLSAEQALGALATGFLKVTTTTGVVSSQVDIALTTDTSGNYVQSVATTSPITGGAAGSEGAVLTLACATCALTTTTITAGVGLSGGGDLSANRTFTLDLAELVDSQTMWDSANASRTFTAGLSGATDPVITFADAVVNISTGTLQQGGTAVALQSLTLTGGAGIGAIGDLSTNRTIATASGEADFLASGALTCGASTQGKMQVHTTALQYCDNAATPTLRYAAYGDSAGAAAAGTLTGTVLNATVVTSSLTSVGTITTGVWTGTAIADDNGGTGQTTYAKGDVLYASAINTLAKLVVGTDNFCLVVNVDVPNWEACPSSGYATIDDENIALTQRTVLNFAGAGVSCEDDVAQTTCTIAGGGGASLDAVTAAAADATRDHTNYEINWQWKKTVDSEGGLRITEPTASTGGTSTAGVPNQWLFKCDTLAASTASCATFYSRGSHVFSVSPTVAQILGSAGSATNPLYSFTADSGAGMFFSASRLRWAVGGSDRLSLTSTGSLVFNNGTATAPIISNNDIDTGIFFSGQQMVITTGSAENARFSAGVLQNTKGSADAVSYAINLRKSRGTVAAPTVITTGDSLGITNYLGHVGATNIYQIGVYAEALSTGTIADTATGIGGIYRIGAAAVGAEPAEIVRWMAATTTGGGWQIMDEADANPTTTELDANDSVAVYTKGNTFVIAYNNAGTVTCMYATLDGSTATWTHSTTCP